MPVWQTWIADRRPRSAAGPYKIENFFKALGIDHAPYELDYSAKET